MEFKVGDIFNIDPPSPDPFQNQDRIITDIVPKGYQEFGEDAYWMWWKPVGRKGGGVSTYYSAKKHWKIKPPTTAPQAGPGLP